MVFFRYHKFTAIEVRNVIIKYEQNEPIDKCKHHLLWSKEKEN